MAFATFELRYFDVFMSPEAVQNYLGELYLLKQITRSDESITQKLWHQNTGSVLPVPLLH